MRQLSIISGPRSEDELRSWSKRLYEGNGTLLSCRFKSEEDAYKYAKHEDAERVRQHGVIFQPYIITEKKPYKCIIEHEHKEVT